MLIALALAGHAQRATPVHSATRTITIATEPSATVFLDGVNYGTTGTDGLLKISPAPSGRKLIRVRAMGFSPVEKPVPATQSGKIAITLTRTSDPAELALQEGERLAGEDRGKAIEAYERAAKLRPGFADAYVALARIYSETGESAKAEKAIAQIRQTKKRLAEASVIEARLLKTTGDDDKAIGVFNRAIREGGGFQPEAYTGLGMLYKDRAEGFGGSGEYAKEGQNYTLAARHLSTAIKQLTGAPDSVVLYQLLGLVYEQQRKPQEAIKVYEEFLRSYPTHTEADAFRSFITQLRKQSEQQ